MGGLLSTCARLCAFSSDPGLLSMQCQDNPIGLNAVIIYGEQEFPMPMLAQEEDMQEGNEDKDSLH